MKNKTIIAVGLALTLVASSASLVQAGGGGLGIPIGGFAVDCYVINGENPPQEVSLDDQFFPGDADPLTPLPRGSVALGKAKLLCTEVNAEVVSGPSPVQPPGGKTDHLVCYQTAANPSPNVLKKITDPFGTQVVVVGSPAYTCVGALKCADDGTGNPCPALP